jgi:hypothetical protein
MGCYFVIRLFLGKIPLRAFPSRRSRKISKKRYFKIFGSLFNSNNVRYLRSFEDSIIDDLNEVSCHLLECMFVKLKFVRGIILEDLTQSDSGDVMSTNVVDIEEKKDV